MNNRATTIPSFKKDKKFGLIPHDWEVVRLDSIAKINQQSLNEQTVGKCTFTYIDLGSVDEGIIDIPNTKIEFANAPSRARRLAQKGDVIMATVRPYLHGFARLHFKPNDTVFSTGFAIITPNDIQDTEYIYQNLYSTMIARQLHGMLVGTNYPAINSTDVESLHIAFPESPKEREIIGNILSTWDSSIHQHEILIRKKLLLKKGLMQQLLTGKRRFPEFIKSRKYIDTRFGPIPEDWHVLKGENLFVRKSKRNFCHEELLSVTQDRGVIPRSMLDGKVTMPNGDRNSFKLVEPGDYVISLRSFQGGLEYSAYRGIVSPAYTILAPKKPICNEYYKQLFKSYVFVGRLAVAVIGIRDGKQISYDDFSYMELPYPGVKEQEKIASVLATCDREISLLQAQAEALKKQKRGLMQKLLTGQTRIKARVI